MWTCHCQDRLRWKLRDPLKYQHQQLICLQSKSTRPRSTTQAKSPIPSHQDVSPVSTATVPAALAQSPAADPSISGESNGISEKVTVAAIDIGTYSFHLVVGVVRPDSSGDGHRRGFEVIDQVITSDEAKNDP